MDRIPRRASWLGALCLLLPACSPGVEPEAGTAIRVANRSRIAFERVVIDSPGGRVELGRVVPGRASEYHPVEEAYPFPYIRAEASSGTLVLQPVDYMDPPLEPGRYTYELDVAAEEPLLRVRLVRP